MDRTKNAARNILWGFINKVVVSLLPFVSRTVVLYVLGTLYLGIGSLFLSILGMLNLAELGFSSAIVYSMYKPLADGNKEKVNALLYFYRKCYRVIGCIILILGILILPFLKLIIRGDYPTDINIYLIYILYLSNTVISYFLFAYKRSLLQANQRNDIESKIATISTVIQYIIQIGVLLTLRNYYIFVFVMVCMTVLSNLMISNIVDRLYPEYACKGSLSRTDYQSLVKQLKGLICRKIGDVVLGSVDNIVISAFLGLSSVAIYGNYYSIITALFGFVNVVSTALKNGVGNVVARESEQYSFQIFQTLNFLYVTMIAFISICFLCLVQPFMKLWVGGDLLFGTDMVLLFTLYIFVYKWCDMLYVFQEAYGIWWDTRFIPIVAAILNLIVNLILVKLIGIQGILISTIVSVLFVYDLGYMLLLFKNCFRNQSLKKYIARQIYYLSIALIASCICMWLSSLGPREGITCILYRCVISVLIGPLVLLLGFIHLPEFPRALTYAKHIIINKNNEISVTNTKKM